MTQKRQTRTKEDIKEALIQLLSEDKFEYISVSKLCKRAGINRGTFYLHYLDKYDMMDRIKEETMSQFQSLFDDDSATTDEILTANFQLLKEHERLINALIKSKYIDFRQAIREFLLTVILDEKQIQHTQKFLAENFHIPQGYALEVFLSSIEGIISLWISSGAQEEPEEITQMILTTFNYDHWKS